MACCAVFHTLLLHVDARIPRDAPAERSVREGRVELVCSHADSVVRFGNWTLDGANCSQSWISREWATHLIPSECHPLPCHSHGKLMGPTEMHIHFSPGNRTHINLHSDSPLSIDLMLGADDMDDDECSAAVVEVHVEQVRETGRFSCHCPISCPLTIHLPAEPISEHELNLTRVLKEVERSNHNRAFWIYFFFRVCASGALATSFSM